MQRRATGDALHPNLGGNIGAQPQVAGRPPRVWHGDGIERIERQVSRHPAAAQRSPVSRVGRQASATGNADEVGGQDLDQFRCRCFVHHAFAGVIRRRRRSVTVAVSAIQQ